MNLLLTINWTPIIQIIFILSLIGIIAITLIYLYKKLKLRILIVNKNSYLNVKEFLLNEKISENNFIQLINSIYKDMELVVKDKDIYVKKTGGAIQQISVRLGQLTESLTNLEKENIDLKNRTALLDHKAKLIHLVILLEDIRRFNTNGNDNILNYIELNLKNILTSFSISEFTNEFLNDEILKYYKFDKEYVNQENTEYIVVKSGFYMERLDGITVLKTAILAVKEI